MSDAAPGLILGLDLGTSKACVSAVDEEGKLRLLADHRGDTVIPAYVSFHPDGNVLVGKEATVRRTVDPSNTLRRNLRPGDTAVVTRAGEVRSVEINTILLDHMRRLADAALQTDTRKVVLTVPWGYGDEQRGWLVRGAKAAALEIVDILPCPIAAAYAYGLEKQRAQFVAVVDFGASKFECSILSTQDGKPVLLASIADMELGGDTITERLVDWMVRGFERDHQIDLRNDRIAMERFGLAAEEAKRRLSTAGEYGVRVEVPAITFRSDGSHVGLQLLLNHEVFDGMTADLVERVARVCDRTVNRAGLRPEQLSQVLLVGGSFRLSPLRERMRAYFARDPRMDVDPEAVCALGAALFAPHRAVSSDRVTSPYGAVSSPPADAADPPLLGRRETRVGRVVTKKMFTAVMQAVTPEGATLHEPITERMARPTLIEVTASRLALSTVGGFCDEIIPSSSPIPTSLSRVFSTGKDDQPSVVLQICQGDSRRFKENMPLGTITLTNLPPRPRGQVRIAVTFAIDDDGVLTALARDEQTGQEQRIRIELPTR
ncbi:MAG TPA: Hsp70 family protein [Kofleriaceae bacterium]|nr:Hsp70 family protein [Kofleriaceae bacterium]